MLFNILHNTEYLIQRGVPEQATTPHVLHKLGDWSVALHYVTASDQTNIPYRLRTRPHNLTMMNKNKFLNDTVFIIRMLYKNSY